MSVLKGLLGANRAEFNRRVEAARRADHSLDAAWFTRLLKEGLEPLVEPLDSPTVGAWVSQAFDMGLELARQGRCKGPMADRIPRLWRALAPMAAGLGPDFKQNLSKITNSLFQLERWGGRPDEFLERLEGIAPGAHDPLAAVVVLGWRCGVPQLRKAALAHAKGMDPALVGSLLGDEALRGGLEAWSTDPWWSAERTPARIVGWIGGFTGDEGPFGFPPRIHSFPEGIVVESGVRLFSLHADRFGQFLTPLSSLPDGEARTFPKEEISGNVLRFPEGQVRLPFPPEGLVLARSGRLVVACSPLSLRLCLVVA